MAAELAEGGPPAAPAAGRAEARGQKSEDGGQGIFGFDRGRGCRRAVATAAVGAAGEFRRQVEADGLGGGAEAGGPILGNYCQIAKRTAAGTGIRERDEPAALTARAAWIPGRR